MTHVLRGQSPATGVDGMRSEVAAKVELVRGLLQARGDDAAVLSYRRNFAWLTAGGDNHVSETAETGVAALVVTPRDVLVVTSVIEADRIRDEELWGLPIEVLAVPWELPGAVDQAIRRRAPGRIVDDAGLEDDLRPLRMVLNNAEQERIAVLGERTSRAITRTLADVQVGDLETVIAKRLDLALAEAGVTAPVILVANDERIGRYRHPIPKPKPIRESVMLVAGASYAGLIVAVTRMAWLGTQPDPETLRRYAAATRVHLGLREATVEGRTLSEVFAAGVDAYLSQGYPDEWRLHHQGGPIGYQGREEFATPGSSVVVRPGMAFAWNPSITGTKVEDTFVVRGDGSHLIVTRDPEWPAYEDGEPQIWIRDH